MNGWKEGRKEGKKGKRRKLCRPFLAWYSLDLTTQRQSVLAFAQIIVGYKVTLVFSGSGQSVSSDLAFLGLTLPAFGH